MLLRHHCRRESHTDTFSYSYQVTDAHSDAYTNAFSDAHSDAHTDAHSDAHTNAHSDAYTVYSVQGDVQVDFSKIHWRRYRE